MTESVFQTIKSLEDLAAADPLLTDLDELDVLPVVRAVGDVDFSVPGLHHDWILVAEVVDVVVAAAVALSMLDYSPVVPADAFILADCDLDRATLVRPERDTGIMTVTDRVESPR